MATDLVVYREPGKAGRVTLHGSTEHDHEQLVATPYGTDIKIVVTIPRNLKFHKMFFSMLKTAFDYMDEDLRMRMNIHAPEELLNRMKLDLGLYDLTILAHDAPGLPAGTALYKARSISFAKMDDAQFKAFFQSCIGVLIGKYLPAQNEQSLMAILRYDA